MALKSAKLSGLKIDKKTYKGASHFLDTVSIEYGAFYGYDVAPNPNYVRSACTAIGLLCRMYMGWDKDHPGLQKGVEWMSNKGPSKDNMYYNYYGSQVMKHYGGEEWTTWNEVMRDYLVDTQATKGDATGSWWFGANSHAAVKGGRLYCTAMACMTLEIYYRYLPLYGDKAGDDEFPLD